MDLHETFVNTFVNDYYKPTHLSLDGFYESDSKIGRLDVNGGMVSLTTEEAKRQNILSARDEMKVEFETKDCHDSHNNGYLVVVRGFMTGADRVKRRFTQTFFLAPRGSLDNSNYYIRNDIFRFEGTDYQQRNNGHDLPQSEKVVTREDAHVNGDVSAAVVEVPVTRVKEVLRAVSTLPTAKPTATPSHAKVPKGNPLSEKTQLIPPPSKIHSQSNPRAQAKPQDQVKPPAQTNHEALATSQAHPRAQAKPQDQVKPPAQANHQAQATPQAQAQIPASSTAPVVNSDAGANNYQNADKRSIKLTNLSVYTTRKQLQEIFQEFGELKFNNIQLKSNNVYGTCHAFIEFADRNAAYNAIETARNFPLFIDNREIFVSGKFSRDQRGGGGGSLSWRSARGDGRVFEGGNRDFNRASYRHENSSDRRSAVKAGKGEAYNGVSDRGVSTDRKADVRMDSSNSNGFNNGGSTNGGSSDHRAGERSGYSNGGNGNSKTSKPRKSSS